MPFFAPRAFSFASGGGGGYVCFMVDPAAMRVTSLYVHVPFCAQKCAYCAFYSEASSGELVNRYVAALIRELELVAGDLKPRTIFSAAARPRCSISANGNKSSARWSV